MLGSTGPVKEIYPQTLGRYKRDESNTVRDIYKKERDDELTAPSDSEPIEKRRRRSLSEPASDDPVSEPDLFMFQSETNTDQRWMVGENIDDEANIILRSRVGSQNPFSPNINWEFMDPVSGEFNDSDTTVASGNWILFGYCFKIIVTLKVIISSRPVRTFTKVRTKDLPLWV